MIKKISTFLLTLGTAAMPALSYAAFGVSTSASCPSGGGPAPLGSGANLCSLINLIIFYLNILLVLLMAVAVVVFVFYTIRYFILTTENRKEAGLYVMYSVIGFFVILSFWGLVNILQNTFGLQNYNQPQSWASFQSIFPH